MESSGGPRSRSRSNTPLPRSTQDRSTPIRGVDVEAIAEGEESVQFTSPPAHRTRNALKQKTTTEGGVEADYLTGSAVLSPIARDSFISEEAAQNIKNYSYEYEQHITTTKTVSSPNNGSYLESSSFAGAERNHSRGSRSCSEKSNESFVESILADSERVSGEGRDHLPYRIYKYAVEYWNKYPKTDYTYSHLSRDRVEVAPGQIAVPNMSRLSLGQYRQGMHVYSGGLDEEESAALLTRTSEMRKRWTTDSRSYLYGSNYNRYNSLADSDYDETDLSSTTTAARASGNQHWWITQLLITIWTTITTSVTTVKNKILRRDSSQRYPYYSASSRYSSQSQSKLTSAKEFVKRRRWWLLLLLLLLLPFIYYFLYGLPTIPVLFYGNKHDNSVERPIGYELSDEMISKIILQLKDYLPTYASEPKVIERIVESTNNNFDPSILTQQQQLIDKLYFEIDVLKQQLAANDNLEEKINTLISKHSNNLLINVFGMEKSGSSVTPENVKAWLGKQTVNKEDFEVKLATTLDLASVKLKEDIDGMIKTQVELQAEAAVKKSIDPDFSAQQREWVDKLYAEINLLKGQLEDNKNLDEKINKLISKYNNDLLINVFGIENHGGSITPENVKAWLGRETVNRDELEAKLASTVNIASVQLKEDLGNMLKIQVTEAQKAAVLNQAPAAAVISGTGCTNCEELVHKVVAGAIALYDADKTGKVDYALESAGGQVVSTRCTEQYQPRSAVWIFMGIPLWSPSNTPRVVIQPGTSPGECWAFQGFPGYIVIKLHTRIHVTGYSIEHAPIENIGQMASAPKNFTVKGLQDEMDRDPHTFGNYVYASNSTALQYFEVKTQVESDSTKLPGHEFVELIIDSNHGHPNYTCLYRFRVHGVPVGNVPDR